jgi:hypothetical protein
MTHPLPRDAQPGCPRYHLCTHPSVGGTVAVRGESRRTGLGDAADSPGRDPPPFVAAVFRAPGLRRVAVRTNIWQRRRDRRSRQRSPRAVRVVPGPCITRQIRAWPDDLAPDAGSAPRVRQISRDDRDLSPGARHDPVRREQCSHLCSPAVGASRKTRPAAIAVPRPWVTAAPPRLSRLGCATTTALCLYKRWARHTRRACRPADQAQAASLVECRGGGSVARSWLGISTGWVRRNAPAAAAPPTRFATR